MMQQTIVSARNVSFRYDSQPVLERVSFELAKGDYIGLVGPNGSGKTTLIKLLLGILAASEGEIELFGQPVSKFSEWQKIGYVPQYVFQADRTFPATVQEVVESGHLYENRLVCQLGLKACSPISEALETVGITNLLHRRIGELSGGERQRVFIARSLVSHPELLILDEPTAGVDQSTQEAFYNLLEKLNKQHGITIVLISHDLEVVAHEAKTALCLNHHVLYSGSAATLHDDQILRQLFGSRIQHEAL